MTKDEHLNKARNNEAFVASLKSGSSIEIEWAITVLFYVAVHYVQAYFVSRHQSYSTHRTRDSAIQRDNGIKKIYSDYRELETFSRDGRYDLPDFKAGHLTYINECLSRLKGTILPLI